MTLKGTLTFLSPSSPVLQYSFNSQRFEGKYVRVTYLPTYCCCRHFDVSNPAKAVLMTDGCQKMRAERVDKLEHVQMHIKLRHGHRGHLKLTLISPAGTRLVDDLSRVLNC